MDLICPYCEAKMEDPDDNINHNVSDHEWRCGYCDKNFIFSVEYEPIYTSHQVPCLNGEPHDYQPATNVNYVICRHCHKAKLKEAI